MLSTISQSRCISDQSEVVILYLLIENRFTAGNSLVEFPAFVLVLCPGLNADFALISRQHFLLLQESPSEFLVLRRLSIIKTNLQ